MGSKYGKILLEIEDQIRHGTLRPGDMLPTEKQYMAQYGVSRTTIQRAMNILVAHELVERIPGRGSFVKSTGRISRNTVAARADFSMVLPYRSPVTIGYFVGAQRVLEGKGATLSVRFCEETSENEVAMLQSITETGTDGILLYPQDFPAISHYFQDLTQELPFPVVTIDQRIDGLDFSGAGTNNLMGGRMAAQYFLDRGCQNFAFISGPFYKCDTFHDRLLGYRQILKQNGFSLPGQNICITKYENEKHRAHVLNFLQGLISSLPLAIFCTTDELAAYVYHGASALGIKIPQQISVIGYDDLELSRFLIPGLTTIRQPYEEIGETAAQLLWNRFENKMLPVTYMQLPVTMIERNSVSYGRPEN